MLKGSNFIRIFLFIIAAVFFSGCKSRHVAPEKEIVKKPEEMDDQIADNIKALLQYAKDNNGKINDSIKLSLLGVVASYYDQGDYHNTWSRKEKWRSVLSRRCSCFLLHLGSWLVRRMSKQPKIQ